jgi:hypothetical protein
MISLECEIMCWFLSLFIFQPWRWRRHVPPKSRLLSTVYTALYPRRQNSVRTSNPIKCMLGLRISRKLLCWIVMLWGSEEHRLIFRIDEYAHSVTTQTSVSSKVRLFSFPHCIVAVCYWWFWAFFTQCFRNHRNSSPETDSLLNEFQNKT